MAEQGTLNLRVTGSIPVWRTKQGNTMKAFGSVRAYHKCRVTRAGFGKKIRVAIFVKSRKAGRRCSPT